MTKGRVTKKSSAELSKTESRILRVLSGLHGFLLNALFQDQSGVVLEISRNALVLNQKTNEDELQSDLHPEARVSQSLLTQNSGPDDGYDMKI